MINLNELTLKEKIGQMFLVAYEGNTITDDIKKLIQDYKIGGIILYRKSFINYENLVKLINDLKDLNKNNPFPLFISIDQEGGRVNRLPKEIKNLRSPFELTKNNNVNTIIEATNITAKILKETGYNMNFAPVLDIKQFKDTHSIGDRCYGENKEDVCKYAIPAMNEFTNNGIIPVIKHFPGHGATQLDSHFFLPIITKKKKVLEKEDMYCFKEAIKNGASAIMVGHLLATNVDLFFPASLSKKFINILRDDLNFTGLIITDSLKMLAIKMIYGEKFAIKKAINAGNDIVMLKYTEKKEMKCIEYITKKVEKNKIDIDKINKSLERIIFIKEKFRLTNEHCYGTDVKKANEIIEKINLI